jgi:hypothetical protein
MNEIPPPPWTLRGYNHEGRPCDIYSLGWTAERRKMVLAGVKPELAALIVDAVNFWNESTSEAKEADAARPE